MRTPAWLIPTPPHYSCLTFPHFMPHSPLILKCTLPLSIPALCLVQLKLWIDEKMLTAQDVSYDEARNLHTKWQKHQAFMAELAANKDWLDKVDKVSSGQEQPPLNTVQGRALASRYGCFRVRSHGASS